MTRGRWFSFIAALILLPLIAIVGVSSAAKADSSQEMQTGCGLHYTNFYNPGTYYQYNPNGSSVIVERSNSYQVAGSWSACEDINIGLAPNYFTISNIYARTYMCSLSNPSNCWYNAWRYCGGGCVVASNMSAGVWYYIEIGNLGQPGQTGYVALYD